MFETVVIVDESAAKMAHFTDDLECCVAGVCSQERDLKTFHEGLKQDMKLMKQSVDMLPKDMRKDVLRQRKEEKDVEQAEKVMTGASVDR